MSVEFHEQHKVCVGASHLLAIWDNRVEARLPAGNPIAKGDVIRIHSWAKGENVLLTLDTGYTISLPKSLLPELVKAAETNA